MINNRQNGRRRGRGGPQVRNGAGGGADRGNRIDNRARGNAAQLHEKYRNLARDAQTQGDRVMTEYYLQFADHYFRVLSENRARFEEQQPRRPQGGEYRDGDYDDGGDEGEIYADDRVGQQPRPEPRYEQRAERQEPRHEPRYEARAEQQPQPPRGPEQDRGEGERAPAPEADAAPVADGEGRRSRRGRRPRRDGEGETVEAERIEVDRLPPAFVQDVSAANGDAAIEPAAEEAPRRRRTRRVKDDGDSVAA